MGKANDRVFMKITNKDIYDEMKAFHEKSDKQNAAIIQRLDVTNGKVKLSKWIATTALTLALVAIAYLFAHINSRP